MLSKKGKNYIEETKRKIKNLTYWLQKTSRLNEEEAHQEAIKLFTTLNKETIESICSRIHFNQVFDQLGDLVEFSGHYLEHHLEPGKYIFSFSHSTLHVIAKNSRYSSSSCNISFENRILVNVIFCCNPDKASIPLFKE